LETQLGNNGVEVRGNGRGQKGGGEGLPRREKSVQGWGKKTRKNREIGKAKNKEEDLEKRDVKSPDCFVENQKKQNKTASVEKEYWQKESAKKRDQEKSR